MRRSANPLSAAVLALFAAFVLALPLSAFASDAGQAVAESQALAAPLTCQQILQASKGAHGGHGEADTAAVILHHVGNDGAIAFDSPLPTEEGVAAGALSLDFKELQCELLGWNGIVSWNGKPLQIAGKYVDLTPTKHTFWLWIGSLLVLVLFLVARPPRGGMVPQGLYSFVEFGVLFVRDDIARKNIPDQKEADRYTPYLLSVFFFILVINLLGLVPWCASATGNVSVTLALALFTFVLTQAATFRSLGFLGFFKHLTGGVHWLLWPIMVPVEILGLFTKPFALTVRLFANMVAGHIVIYFLLGLIFILGTIYVAPVSVIFAVAIYMLELFVAFLQAFIFTLLSAIFIGLGVAAGQHGHGDHEAEGAEHQAE